MNETQSILNEVKKKVILTVVVIIVTIIVYAVVGFWANISYVRIYDKFPEDFICRPPNPEVRLSYNVWNKAPFSLPFVNPFYLTRVLIIDSENDTFAYFIGGGGKKYNFTTSSCDLGLIDSGSYNDFNFNLHLSEGQCNIQNRSLLIVPHTVGSCFKNILCCLSRRL